MHRFNKGNGFGCYGHHPQTGDLPGKDPAGDVHLGHDPAAEDVAMRIGVSRHCEGPENQFALGMIVFLHTKFFYENISNRLKDWNGVYLYSTIQWLMGCKIMTVEQRRFSRIIFNVRALLAMGETIYTVERIVNLSVGGCQLEIDAQFQLGEPCKFMITLPRMGPGVEVLGEIVRVGSGEVSLKFTRIDPENLMHLQNIIRYNAEDPKRIEEEIKAHPGLL